MTEQPSEIATNPATEGTVTTGEVVTPAGPVGEQVQPSGSDETPTPAVTGVEEGAGAPEQQEAGGAESPTAPTAGPAVAATKRASKLRLGDLVFTTSGVGPLKVEHIEKVTIGGTKRRHLRLHLIATGSRLWKTYRDDAQVPVERPYNFEPGQ